MRDVGSEAYVNVVMMGCPEGRGGREDKVGKERMKTKQGGKREEIKTSIESKDGKGNYVETGK